MSDSPLQIKKEPRKTIHTCAGCGKKLYSGDKVGLMPLVVASGVAVPVWPCPGCGILQMVKGAQIDSERIIKPKSMVSV